MPETFEDHVMTYHCYAIVDEYQIVGRFTRMLPIIKPETLRHPFEVNRELKLAQPIRIVAEGIHFWDAKCAELDPGLFKVWETWFDQDRLILFWEYLGVHFTVDPNTAETVLHYTEIRVHQLTSQATIKLPEPPEPLPELSFEAFSKLHAPCRDHLGVIS